MNNFFECSLGMIVLINVILLMTTGVGMFVDMFTELDCFSFKYLPKKIAEVYRELTSWGFIFFSIFLVIALPSIFLWNLLLLVLIVLVFILEISFKNV